MALKKAGTPAPSRRADGSVEEVPEDVPRGRGGRPKIRALVPDLNPGAPEGALMESPTVFESFTRASTLGKTLEDTFGIQRWEIRTVVFGLSRRPDLVLKAASIPGADSPDDKDKLAEVADAAKEAGKGNAGATKGTALHLLSEQLDAGVDLSHLPSDALAALGRYRDLMSAVRIVATETFVVNDALGAAGTFDRVVELIVDTDVTVGGVVVATLPAGTRVGVDLKTNKDAKYFGPTYSCQQATYFVGAVPYTHGQGRIAWPDGLAPSSEWALILHVPIESPADAAWWWVDLRQGYELAELATTVRAQRGREDLFHPAELGSPPKLVEDPAPVVAVPAPRESVQLAKVKLIAALRYAVDEPALDALYEANVQQWDEDCTRMVKARLRELALTVPPAAVVEVDSGPADVLHLIGVAPDEPTLDLLWQEFGQTAWPEGATAAVRARLAELDGAKVAAR